MSFDNLLVYKKGYTRDQVYRLIKDNSLHGLRIFSELKNDRLEDISFLESYTFLENLDVTSINDFNFDFLSKLVNLKSLSINTVGTNDINLGNQVKLENLSIQWRKGVKGLENCTSLSSIGVTEFKEPDLARLTGLKGLIDLRIKTASIESLDGLNQLVTLKRVLIANCKKLISVKSINQLTKLQHLEFNRCPNIKDYHSLTNLPSLQTFAIIDCGRIESIKFIERYPLLSKLSLLGNTVIIDGDLLPAKQISSVEYKHYEHYNIKIENPAYEQTVKGNLQKIRNLIKR